jgi:hypothetical protein
LWRSHFSAEPEQAFEGSFDDRAKLLLSEKFEFQVVRQPRLHPLVRRGASPPKKDWPPR